VWASRGSVLLRLFAAFYVEALAMTRPDFIAGAVFAVAAFTYQFVTGGITRDNYASWLLPSMWTVLLVTAWLFVRAAARVRRELIAEWEKWKPILVGSPPPRKPSLTCLVITTAAIVAALTGAIVLTIVFVPVGRAPSGQIVGFYKFKDTQSVSGVQKAILCDRCDDELDLDGDGFLYVSDIGRGIVEMTLSSVPTIALHDPDPGDVALPQVIEAVNRGVRAKSPLTDSVSIVTNVEGASIGLRGTHSEGKVTITHVVIPEDFPSATIKIRERLSEYRFEVGARRRHTIAVAGRTFDVTLTGTREAPEPGGKRTVFSYTFHINEL
jgi:hypothetical protein